MPQGDVEHAADQLTPPWAGSFATVAVMETVCPCGMVGGEVGEVMVTEIGGGVTVTVIEAVLLVSPTEVAVTVTARFAETEAGAAKVVGVPLAVLAGLTEPHADTAQLTAQVTPWLAGSMATVAVMETVWPCWMVGGEAGEVMVTVIFDGLTVMDNVPDVTTMAGLPESVAVTVNVEVVDDVTKPVLNWPGFVSLGMPESSPLELKVKPAGSDPEKTFQLMVPAPPELSVN